MINEQACVDEQIVMGDGHVVVWQHRCSDGIGGCTAFSQATLGDILAIAHDARYSDEHLGNVVRFILGRELPAHSDDD